MLYKTIIPVFLLNLAWFFATAQSPFQNINVWGLNYINEPSICINPKNVNQMVGGANNNRFFYSNDGGLTWGTGTLASPWGVWGDPVIIVDTSNAFYFFHLSYPSSPGWWIDRIICQKSTNGGQTWSTGTYFGWSTYPKAQDKEWAVVDRRNNNIYATWTQFDSYGSSNPVDSTTILFTKSTDQGTTWSTPKRISRRAGDCIDSGNTNEGAVPAVGPNGEIYVSWAGPLGLMFNRSFDEGESWVDANIFVSDIPGGWDYAIPGINRANGLPVTCCDLSSGPNAGNVYINWSDQRNGSSDTDIWFIKSTDQGSTWSPKIRVNDDPPGKQQFFTWMTVDQVTGYIYIVFYDRRNYTDTQTDVYMAVSTDGGATFENMRISQAPFTPNNCPTGYNFFGDYTNISAYNNIVRPIWATCDNSQQSIKIAIIDNLFTTPTAPTVNVVNNCGSSTLTATGYTGSLLWSTGATTASITVTLAGTYTVTQTVNGLISPAGSCTASPKTVPLASALSSYPVLVGSTLTLGSFPDGMASYSWTGPNGFTSTAQNPDIPNVTEGASGIYHVTVTNSSSCTASASVSVEVTSNGGPYYTISGTLKYNNLATTPMKLVTLALNETGATSTTNSNGNYSFPGLTTGTYTMSVTSNNKSAGGINSTDAVQVNYWSASQTLIEHVKFLSGDVSDNNAINATDALKVQNYFVFGTPFDRTVMTGTPWVYWREGDLISNNFDPNVNLPSFPVLCNGNIIINIFGQVIGDFGGSFTPNTAKGSGVNVALVNNNTKQSGASTQVELPVLIENSLTIGAISLILDFPADMIEVTGITMKENDGELAWSVKGNELRIGWNSIHPLSFEANDALFVIRLKTSETLNPGDVIQIKLAADPLNELADGNFKVVENAVLGIDVIEISTYGLAEEYSKGSLGITSRPNPFRDEVTISYYLPADGQVSLQITDVVGLKVLRLIDEFQHKGIYSLSFDAKNMISGVYSASVILINNKEKWTGTTKMILTR